MQAIGALASVRRCSGRPSIFASRPDLKTTVLSLRLQQQTHADALAGSRACPISLRGMARIVAAVTPFQCAITALPFFEAEACARNGSRAEPADQFARFIAQASDRFAVPTRWIRAVMQIESAGDERATLRRGAMGLMQIMPPTWVEPGVRYGLGLSTRMTRTTTYWGAQRTSNRCMTASDRLGSLRPNMRVRCAMSSIWRRGARSRLGPWPTLPRSRR
jgi:hypothetical protein